MDERAVRDGRQVERLRRLLRDREARLAEAEARVTALESSTALRVGRVLVKAARRPGRGMVTLPRDLWRLWRGRPTGPRARREQPSVTPGPLDLARDEERLLLGHSVPPEGRLVVGGVLTEETAAAFAAHAHVVPLLPHDAPLVLDKVDPDVVIVEAAATRAGNPWAYVGDPAVPDRARRLLHVLEIMHRRERPVALWRDAPVSPGLAQLPWDAVVADDVGVPLHRFHPAGLDPRRATHPYYAGPSDPRLPAAIRVVIEAALGGDDVEIAVPDWPHRPAALRRHALVLADTPERVLQALACGARVVAPAAATPDGGLARFVTTVDDPAEASARIAAARAAGPRPAAEVRAVLRELFLHHATPVRLAGVTRRLDLDADPLAGRSVAVLARPADAAEAGVLAALLLAQMLRPAEVVVPAVPEPGGDAASRDTATRRALAALSDRGVRVRVVAEQDDWRSLAAAAQAPWVAIWPSAAPPPGHLADLVAAAECSGADAVGSAGSTASYTYVTDLEPALARRDLVTSGDPPREWIARHGARLLAI